MRKQPIEVNSPRIVATPRLCLNVVRFPLAPQQTTDGCQANAKQFGRLFVRACLPRPVGSDDTPTKVQ